MRKALQVYFTEAEYSQIQKLAEKQGRSLSQMVRHIVRKLLLDQAAGKGVQLDD